MTKFADACIGWAIKTWLFLIFVAFVVLPRACGKDIKEYLAESARTPTQCACKSGEFVEKDGRHYWQTEGIRNFADGSNNKGLVFRAEYHTMKQMRKIRRKALMECANWLDQQETKK